MPGLARGHRPRRPPSVLLVLGEDAGAAEIARRLEDDGLGVERVLSAREGLERMGRRLPTAVVVDDAVKDPPLPDLLAAMRADPLTAHIPVIALTRGEARVGPGPLAPDAVLRKPVDPAELGQLLWSRIGRGAGRLLVVGATSGPAEEWTARLRGEGWAALRVDGRAQARERLGREPFPVMILDLDSPGVDGLGLIEDAEALPEPSRPRILAVTDGRGMNLLERRNLERRVVALLRRTGLQPELLARAVRALSEPLGAEATRPAEVEVDA